MEDITTQSTQPKTQPTTVVNVGTGQHCDVFIGRPSRWGNPFKPGVHGSRQHILKLYAEYIRTRPDLLAQIPNLKGKSLGCFCAPLPCHGDILADLADNGIPGSVLPVETPQ